MSLGRITWVSALFLVGAISWVNGAAVPNLQPPPQKAGPDLPHNTLAPAPADLKTFRPIEPIRPNSPNIPPPPQPFGINSNMQMHPPTPPQGFLMSPPSGFRPGMVMIPQAPQPAMPQPNMNTPNHLQGQPPKIPVMVHSTTAHPSLISSSASRPNNNTRREIEPPVPQPNLNATKEQPKQTTTPAMANSTMDRPSLINTTMDHPTVISSNASRPNNNTRREAEPSPTTPSATTTTSPTTSRKPFQESPLGADKQHADGSQMKQTSQMPQTLPINPFNPMMQPLNPMMQPPNQMMQPFPMMNQPLFIDPMGRLMMLVPFNPLQMPRDPNQQQSLPQGPPIPIQVPFNPQMQFQFGQPQPRPIMADVNKQPPRMGEASKNATSTN